MPRWSSSISAICVGRRESQEEGDRIKAQLESSRREMPEGRETTQGFDENFGSVQHELEAVNPRVSEAISTAAGRGNRQMRGPRGITPEGPVCYPCGLGQATIALRDRRNATRHLVMESQNGEQAFREDKIDLESKILGTKSLILNRGSGGHEIDLGTGRGKWPDEAEAHDSTCRERMKWCR